METNAEREIRLDKARQDALKRFRGPVGLIPGVVGDGAASIEETEKSIEEVKENPLDGAVFDALVYFRAGMNDEEIRNAILIRNKINYQDAQKVIDQLKTLMKEVENVRTIKLIRDADPVGETDGAASIDTISHNRDVFGDTVRSSESDLGNDKN